MITDPALGEWGVVTWATEHDLTKRVSIACTDDGCCEEFREAALDCCGVKMSEVKCKTPEPGAPRSYARNPGILTPALLQKPRCMFRNLEMKCS